MLLVGQWRLTQLIQQRSRKNDRLRELTMELTDLKSYATNIADGKLSMNEMASCPTSMFNRQMQYMMASSQYCQMAAQNQMTQLTSNPLYQQMMVQSQNAQMQAEYQKMMYRSFYKQAQEQFAKYEAKLLNEKETEMQKEKTSLETELAMINEEIKATKEGIKNDIPNFVPQYA